MWIAKRILNQAGELSPLGSSPLPGPANRRIKVAGKKKGRTMNPLIQLKTTPPLFITLVLLCFGLLPRGQAVDTGQNNTATGWRAFQNNITSSDNTATGSPSATPTCSPGGSPGLWTYAASVEEEHYGGFIGNDGTFYYEGGGYSFCASCTINEFGRI